MKVSTLLDQIDLGAMALPTFQRGYVWNRDQVRAFIASLYRRHPVGSLLVWVTATDDATTKGQSALQPGFVKLLLDGQQRITTLYGLVRGRAPAFFEGDTRAFTGLRFHLRDEVFEFYTSLKMADDPLWIDVTQVLRDGPSAVLNRLNESAEHRARFGDYVQRLSRLHSILEVDLHVEEVAGEDKTVDVVVEIFNAVNSGGTKLSKGDLALAKMCARWPGARDALGARLQKWQRYGFSFRMEWLLRNVTTALTGQAMFAQLENVGTKEFEQGLTETEKSIDYLLNLIASRLGLDHDRVLGSRYSFPVMARYLAMHGIPVKDARERDRLLYWYVHSFLWGRYAGSTESVMNHDLAVVNNGGTVLDHLVDQLHRDRAVLQVTPEDLWGWGQGARFYPLLYMLTRAYHARDWASGLGLSSHLLGAWSQLHMHHIFPKARLYKAGYSRSEVNALANFTFLTAETNGFVSDRLPSEYLAEFASRHPGVIESHWIPNDPRLWEIENYREFLAERRRLLAEAANAFLNALWLGGLPEERPASALTTEHAAVGGIASEEEEEQVLLDLNVWVVRQGLPEGEFQYEITDTMTGRALAVLDLAWPDGLQVGLSQPVAVLIDEDEETEAAANRAGFRYFTNPREFQEYVRSSILAEADALVGAAAR